MRILSTFKKWLQIRNALKLPDQQFEELLFEEEILTFLRYLGHSREIKDSSIPRRNKVNWHFSRDDPMFTMIKVVSRHEDTHLYAEPPKTKASVKKKQAGSDKTKTPLTAKDHEDQDDDNEQTDSDNNGDDFVHPKFSTHDEEDNEEEGSDQRFQTPSHYESTDDEESDEVTHGRMLREKNWMKKRQIKRTKTTSKAEVLARSSNESKTSYAIAANLSELELKKILIDKMESNKSIYRSDEQKNLYKALVDAYESDKLILDTYGDTVTFIRHQDDEDKRTEENPRWINTGGLRDRREEKNPEST
ncbi:hypothetical protein Tco_1132732 [Tanacetum coccineum]|uniref:Uncharacterized protein n=1 Tax=Tanacetum coccineum TaxID=301880 RepID=A0ABQ5JDF9_9ASTR